MPMRQRAFPLIIFVGVVFPALALNVHPDRAANTAGALVSMEMGNEVDPGGRPDKIAVPKVLREATKASRIRSTKGKTAQITADQWHVVMPLLQDGWKALQVGIHRLADENSASPTLGMEQVLSHMVQNPNPMMDFPDLGGSPSLEEVMQIVVSVLDAFRDRRFVDATLSGLDNISLVISNWTNYTTEKLMVMDSLGASDNVTEAEAINYMRDFFQAEARLLGHMSVAVTANVERVIRSIPKNSTFKMPSLAWTNTTFILVTGFLEGYFDDVFGSANLLEDPANDGKHQLCGERHERDGHSRPEPVRRPCQ